MKEFQTNPAVTAAAPADVASRVREALVRAVASATFVGGFGITAPVRI